MQIQGQVGPQAVTASMPPAAIANVRLGNLGDIIVSELHGRYYETAYRRNLYNAANQVGATTTLGTTAIYTGLCLSNPIGSGWNLVLNKVSAAFLVAFTASAAIGLMCGFNAAVGVTHTVPGVPRNNFFGIGNPGVGLVDTSCTMPTAPFVTHLFGAGLTGAITTMPEVTPTLYDFEGCLILPPGGYAAIYTSTVSGAGSMFASFQWEEIPV